MFMSTESMVIFKLACTTLKALLDFIWYLSRYSSSDQRHNNEAGYQIEVDISQEKDAFLKDHVVDGRIIYPGAGYLVMAWEALAKQCNLGRGELDVIIKDVKIHDSTVLKPEGAFTLFDIVYHFKSLFEDEK